MGMDYHKDKNSTPEKRKHPRTKVQIWAQEKGDNYTCFHLISNLSCGGLMIEKKLPFAPGSVLNLELELVDTGQKISFQGLVVNNYDAPDGNLSGTGLKFIDISADDQKKIEAFLKQIENNQAS